VTRVARPPGPSGCNPLCPARGFPAIWGNRRPSRRWRMSESARWPRITAATAESGQKKKTRPQIKLAIALPLFCERSIRVAALRLAEPARPACWLRRKGTAQRNRPGCSYNLDIASRCFLSFCHSLASYGLFGCAGLSCSSSSGWSAGATDSPKGGLFGPTICESASRITPPSSR